MTVEESVDRAGVARRGVDRQQRGDLRVAIEAAGLDRSAHPWAQADRLVAEETGRGVEGGGHEPAGAPREDADVTARIADPEADGPLLVEDGPLGPAGRLLHPGPVVDAVAALER